MALRAKGQARKANSAGSYEFDVSFLDRVSIAALSFLFLAPGAYLFALCS